MPRHKNRPVRARVALPVDNEQTKQALLAFADDLAVLALSRFLKEWSDANSRSGVPPVQQ